MEHQQLHVHVLFFEQNYVMVKEKKEAVQEVVKLIASDPKKKT